MARKRTGLIEPGNGGFPCGKCGVPMLSTKEDFANPGIWIGEQTVYHCEGAPNVFRSKLRRESHHYNSAYGGCWKCGRGIGCFRCCGSEEQILCENWREHGDLGSVWATKKAFLANGPLVRQRDHGRRQLLTDYPPDWATLYEPMEVSGEAARAFLDRLVRKLAHQMAMQEPEPRDFD